MPPQNERLQKAEDRIDQLARDYGFLKKDVEEMQNTLSENALKEVRRDGLIEDIKKGIDKMTGSKWTLNRFILIAKDLSWLIVVVWLGLVLLNPTALNQKIQDQAKATGVVK